MNIGINISELRKKNNYSQEKLAELLCVSRQAVTKWEADESIPELSKLIALADLFDVSLDRLVGRKETDYAALKERITELSNKCVAEFGGDVSPMICRYMEYMEEIELTPAQILNGIKRICAVPPDRRLSTDEISF